MRLLAVLCLGFGSLCLGGCVLPGSDPALAGRSTYWYRHTDPAAFFDRERAHGRVYFLGVYDPARGADSPAPGIARRDPAFRVARTWFVAEAPFVNDDQRNAAYDAAVRRFAERYNPLVLAYLRAHPDAGNPVGAGVK